MLFFSLFGASGVPLIFEWTLLQDVGLKPHICGKGFAALAKFDGPMEYPVEGYAPLGSRAIFGCCQNREPQLAKSGPKGLETKRCWVRRAQT